jgi:hypothetical protein
MFLQGVMKFFLSSLVILAPIVAITAPAQAAQITFNFVGPSLISPSLSYSDPSGLSVTSSGFSDSGKTSFVSRNTSGLGVTTNAAAAGLINGDKVLQLDFNHIIQVINATFGSVNTGDDFLMTVGHHYVADAVPSSAPFVFSPLLSPGNIVQFSKFNTGDSYRLKSITVDYTPTSVPTPALLPGLVGMALGVLRRRSAI